MKRHAGPGPTHLPSNLGPLLVGPARGRACDTSRSHLTYPHCSSLGQPGRQAVGGRQGSRSRGTRTEATLTFLIHIKYYDPPCGHVRDDNLRDASASRRRRVSLSVFLALSSSRVSSRRLIHIAAETALDFPNRFFNFFLALTGTSLAVAALDRKITLLNYAEFYCRISLSSFHCEF